MKNEIFMSMLPMWHTQEILSPELNSSGDFNFSSSLVDKAAAADNPYPLKNFNSSAVSSSLHIFHPPVKSNNSLLKELIGKMALNSSTGNFSPISQVSNFRSRSSNGRFCPNRREGSKNRVTEYQGGLSSSHEDQIRRGETGVDLKKRKSSGRLMVAEVEDDSNSKRTKQIEDDNNRAEGVCKDDYIHVRARMGQATDNHSLSERVRREKIGERMKILQNLVPGCNKVTGKAVMLDEIINYVQSLQRQVQFLSMKLVSMNANGISNSNLKVETAVDSSPFMNSSTGSTLNPPLDPTPFHPLASNRFMRHHILPTNEDLKVQYHELFGDELHYIVTTGYGA